MRFTKDNFDIPNEIVNCLENDNLVIFVGAGVSAQAYPKQKEGTYYPTYKLLVHAIGDRLEHILTDDEKKLLEKGFSDRILGQWEKKYGIDEIHKLASEILQQNEAEQRINLHRAIVRLFPEESTPRIITTNFDNLLAIALEQEGYSEDPRWKVHKAPSLPPANKDRFTGICFLHGHAKEAKEMVLSDKDIGRAYMDEGWALKFAHDLFHNFNVVFIGYSLEDPPLRYLSLALEGHKDKDHWAFVPNKKPKLRDNFELDWQRRGVEPIWFPAPRNDFRSLERNISAWAEHNRRNYVDKRNILAGRAKSDPTHLLPYEIDRIKFFLRTPELLRDFAENDLHEKWFEELVSWEHFDSILKNPWGPPYPHPVLSSVLIHWLLNQPKKWMIKLAPFRENIHYSLFDFLCREFERNSKKYSIDIEELRMLLEFFKPQMARSPRKEFSSWIGTMLRQLIQKGFIDDAIFLFMSINITDPIIKTASSLRYLLKKETGEDISGMEPLELDFNFDFMESSSFHSRKYIKDIFMSNITEIGYQLITAITYQFLDLRRALKRGGGGQRTYMRRHAIENHKQDEHQHGVFHFFINALRDIWESLLEVEPEKAIKILHHWREIDDEIFNRLCLHAARRILEKGNVE